MPTPQFDSPVVNGGFDKDAMPPWMLVARQSTKLTLLYFAKWNVVKSDNANITIKEVTTKDTWASFLTRKNTSPNYLTPTSRWFNITGVTPGLSRIYVSDPDYNNTFVLRLEVEVKERKRYTIAYHFLDKTTYKTTDISNQVHGGFDFIFGDQANVGLDMTRAAPSPSTASLHGIIFELKNEDRRKPSHREWDRLVDWADRGADFNVYFMPWDGRSEDRPTEILARDNHIICPDGMELEEVERALAHEIARSLGCNVTNNPKQKHHLMFRASSDSGDLGKFVRSGDYLRGDSRRLQENRFIPRDCANTMNPTVP